MDEYPDEYEWDPNKARRNLAKHGVSFADAVSVFDDQGQETIFDAPNSRYEERFLTIGRAGTGRLLVVAHSRRGDRIGVISARPASKREQQRHDQEKRRFIPLP